MISFLNCSAAPREVVAEETPEPSPLLGRQIPNPPNELPLGHHRTLPPTAQPSMRCSHKVHTRAAQRLGVTYTFSHIVCLPLGHEACGVGVL